MITFDLNALHDFIIRAKAATYVGSGQKLLPYRLGSHDLQFVDGDLAYHDSYLGESDFIGEEIVYYQRQVVWGMNYFGYLLQPDQFSSAQAGHVIKISLTRLYQEGRFLVEAFSSAQAGHVIKISLTRLYQEGRFLGGFEHTVDGLRYVDTNEGDVQLFHGKEWIAREGQIVYELLYHGGLVKN